MAGLLLADRSPSKRSPPLYRHQALFDHLLGDVRAACRVLKGPVMKKIVELIGLVRLAIRRRSRIRSAQMAVARRQGGVVPLGDLLQRVALPAEPIAALQLLDLGRGCLVGCGLWAALNSCPWRTLSAAASSTKRDGSRSFFFSDGLRATAGFAVRFAAARFGRRAQCFLYWRVAFLRVVTLPFARHAAAMSPPLASAAAKMAPSPSVSVATMPPSWTDAPRSPQESGFFAHSSRNGLRFCSGRFCYVFSVFVCVPLWDFVVVCRVPATAGESKDLDA